ncbi:hypothetical protein [Streptomyces cinnamoneus]|uniref:Ricin B lectin domain-containing protein n=1 Tax=Streptomyces cinnamoneus TaxID=53446 RepID=A0A918TE89_STRCJ|nr:hypothetical protein [Streptomyces cinnamoneus]GHC45463.1 hypothetical protein GCM10010507_20930 [Streptomyces cinnamoneus]
MIRRVWRPAVAAAVGVCAFVGMAAPAPAAPQPPQARAAASGYLNLHQCMYYSSSATNHFSTVVPSSDGRFAAGTNVSGTADSQVSCGAGDGNYQVVPILSGVKALNLASGRYVNIHQCVYYSSSATNHFTTVVPSSDGRFAAGTNVSNTADSQVSCGAGDGNYQLVPILSGVKALDLTSGRYVNLHQCMYYSSSASNHFSTVVPSSDGRFAAGTNVSNTADSQVTCGAGDGNYQLVPILSGVKALAVT